MGSLPNLALFVSLNSDDLVADMDAGLADDESLCESDVEGFFTTTIGAGLEVSGAVIEDIDGDGSSDVAVNEQLDNRIRVFWGDGSGGFSASETTLVPIGRSGAPGDIADLNGDGHMDLVWGSQDEGEVWVAMGVGGRSFASATSFDHPGGPNRLKLADLNGDGAQDVLIRDRWDSCIRRRFGHGDGSFGESTCLLTPSADFDVGDVDGDGRMEVLMSSGGGLMKVELTASGEVDSESAVDPWPLASATLPHLLDLDSDGDLDVLISRDYSIAVYRNDGDGNFEGCMYAEDLAFNGATFGYLNGDSRFDIVAFDTCSFCSSEVHFILQE